MTERYVCMDVHRYIHVVAFVCMFAYAACEYLHYSMLTASLKVGMELSVVRR